MKLTDLDKKNVATRALKESFATKFDTSSLNRPKTVEMLRKVKTLIGESRNSHEFHKTQNSPSYLKLVFMEQALSQHLATLPRTKIIVENSEVDKSQVILAAQDMIDTIQKMYEDTNDMVVKELPALSDSIQSQIGVNESTSFSQAASNALTTVNTALQTAMNEMKGALGILTGQAAPDAFGADDAGMGTGEEMDLPPVDGGDDLGLDADADLNLDAGDEEMDLSADLGGEENDPVGVVGRAKR